MIVFRQMFDAQSSTYTYLLADPVSHDCVVIDPVFEQGRRDAAFIGELGLTLAWSLETHVHADHVTGAWLLKQRLGGRIALAEAGRAEGADRLLRDGDRIPFGERHLEVRATPGHDYRGATSTSVGEEERFNPRVGGSGNEKDFIGYMANLGLAHPKQMDIAVPANLRCCQPEGGRLPADPDWAPLNLTFAGFWEVMPYWLEEHAAKVQILDVREPDEFIGPLGHIEGALSLPLGQLGDRSAELHAEKPVVTVCRSGGRSAQATAILRRKGFEKIANLAGGMLLWNAEMRPKAGGIDYDAGL